MISQPPSIPILNVEMTPHKNNIWEDKANNRWYMDTSVGRIRIGAQKPRIDIYKDGLIVEAKAALNMVKEFGKHCLCGSVIH